MALPLCNELLSTRTDLFEDAFKISVELLATLNSDADLCSLLMCQAQSLRQSVTCRSRMDVVGARLTCFRKLIELRPRSVQLLERLCLLLVDQPKALLVWAKFIQLGLENGRGRSG